MLAKPKAASEKIPALCHNNSAGSSLLGGKPLLPGSVEEKKGPTKAPCMSQDGGSTQNLPSLLPPFPLHSGTAALKGIVKRSHLALEGRKGNGLAVEGKTATICYSNQESLLGTGQ